MCHMSLPLAVLGIRVTQGSSAPSAPLRFNNDTTGPCAHWPLMAASVTPPPMQEHLMQRRDLLRLLGGVAAVPVLSGLDSERLWAIADGTHARASTAARALAPHELATVSAAADLIIPRTGTPG